MRGSFHAVDNILTLFLINLGKYLFIILLSIHFSKAGGDLWILNVSFILALISTSIIFFGLVRELRLQLRIYEFQRKNMPLIFYDENVLRIRHHRVFLSWRDIQKVEFEEDKNTLLFHESTSSKIHEVDLV